MGGELFEYGEGVGGHRSMESMRRKRNQTKQRICLLGVYFRQTKRKENLREEGGIVIVARKENRIRPNKSFIVYYVNCGIVARLRETKKKELQVHLFT